MRLILLEGAVRAAFELEFDEKARKLGHGADPGSGSERRTGWLSMTRPPGQGKANAVSESGTLAGRSVTKNIAPYLRLARADRPIGYALLALPCFWSVALAGRSIDEPYPDPWLLVLFALGAIVMRAAGCTYNDLIDREI